MVEAVQPQRVGHWSRRCLAEADEIHSHHSPKYAHRDVRTPSILRHETFRPSKSDGAELDGRGRSKKTLNHTSFTICKEDPMLKRRESVTFAHSGKIILESRGGPRYRGPGGWRSKCKSVQKLNISTCACNAKFRLRLRQRSVRRRRRAVILLQRTDEGVIGERRQRTDGSPVRGRERERQPT